MCPNTIPEVFKNYFLKQKNSLKAVINTLVRDEGLEPSRTRH